jgi:hypothetical protein
VTEKTWQYTSAVALFTLLITIGACMARLLSKISDYSIMWDPPQASEIVWCCVYGLAAVAVALKLDIPFLGSIMKGDLQTALSLLTTKKVDPGPPGA